jgi:large subunit ribosomal protein L18e
MISKTNLNKKAQRKNLELKQVIFDLKKKKNPEFFVIARYLALPRRKTISVNLEKINKYSKTNETIVVPGKVLSKGTLDHKIELIAFKTSKTANERIKESGSTFKPIKQFLKEDKKFKIII